jgi:hypothetical protein
MCSSQLHVVPRDTSSKFAPLNPHHKFDFSFVAGATSSAKEGNPVAWVNLVMFEELKYSFETKHVNQLAIQLTDGFLEVLQHKQQGRGHMFAMAGCGYKLDIVRMDSNLELLRTGPQDFLYFADKPTTGFALYVRLLVSPLERLGYLPVSCCAPASVLERLPKGTTSELERQGRMGKPHIFRLFGGELSHLSLSRVCPTHCCRSPHVCSQGTALTTPVSRFTPARRRSRWR